MREAHAPPPHPFQEAGCFGVKPHGCTLWPNFLPSDREMRKGLVALPGWPLVTYTTKNIFPTGTRQGSPPL